MILRGLMLSKFSLSKFYLITSVNFSSNWCILFRKMFLNILLLWFLHKYEIFYVSKRENVKWHTHKSKNSSIKQVQMETFQDLFNGIQLFSQNSPSIVAYIFQIQFASDLSNQFAITVFFSSVFRSSLFQWFQVQ